MKKLNLALAAALAASALSASAYSLGGMESLQAAPAGDRDLAHVLADPARAEDAKRDQYRHPAETLVFFGVKPGMTVVDFMPGGGWYTAVLVPYLGQQGTYVGLHPDVSKIPERHHDRYADAASKIPTLVEQLGVSGARVIGANTDSLPQDLVGKVDRVLMFREFHNQYRWGSLHSDLVAVRALLKDDGMVGVVEHRAKSNAPASYTLGDKGYMRERDVISAFEAAGFNLVAASEINANQLDTADHPGGVWELPPSWSSQREELKVIGESDRMTLLFKKRP